jgi:hypothetical protein
MPRLSRIEIKNVYDNYKKASHEPYSEVLYTVSKCMQKYIRSAMQ